MTPLLDTDHLPVSIRPAVGLEAPVDPVLHHGHELLVAQQTVPVIVEYLEHWNTVRYRRTFGTQSVCVSNIGTLEHRHDASDIGEHLEHSQYVFQILEHWNTVSISDI